MCFEIIQHGPKVLRINYSVILLAIVAMPIDRVHYTSRVFSAHVHNLPGRNRHIYILQS